MPVDLISPVVKWIVASSAFGAGMIFFAWMFIRERKINSALQVDHDAYGKEVTRILLESAEKQTEAITRNTDALNNLRVMTERVLFDVTRSFTPPPRSPDV